MKKLLFALSIAGMLMLCGCNPCKVGDCTCIMWKFDNDTDEIITVKQIKNGNPSSITIPAFAFVEVYVDYMEGGDIDYDVSFNYTPKSVSCERVIGSYTYRFHK